MARAAGLSPASVQRLWAASDIKPHLSRTFKLSNDKRFEEKFWDVIGLYLNPPDKALVLCCDEKSQCQALERTQPGLPLGIGHIRTKTHDYVRHGTLTLFAALNYLEGKLITRLAARHRHQEWLAFLKTIDAETPADLDIHIIADNYATHKHPAVTRWLDRHARFHMHYTPTSSSWMNLVERFFRDLTEFITEKSFASTRELADAIIAFLAARNENPRRYVWKAKGEDILRKINAARAALAVAQADCVEKRLDRLRVVDDGVCARPVRAPQAAIEPPGVEQAGQRLPDVREGIRFVRQRAGAADLDHRIRAPG